MVEVEHDSVESQADEIAKVDCNAEEGFERNRDESPLRKRWRNSWVS